MDNCSYLKIYNAAEDAELKVINRNEIRRYAGMLKGAGEGTDDKQAEALMEECITEVLAGITYRVSYLVTEDDRLPFDTCGSQNIMTNLKGCGRIVLFAATIGPAIDRLINRYGRTSPARALFMQAIGAERIEALCDRFCKDISTGMIEQLDSGGHYKTHPRYSPGYGDLPLTVQKDFFGLLDCNRKLGLTLNESLLMSPSKSVTAIVGIEDDDGMRGCRETLADGKESIGAKGHNCKACTMTECEYRNNIQ